MSTAGSLDRKRSGRRNKPVTLSYRCLILDMADQVVRAETFRRDDDEAAINDAIALSTTYRNCHYELWRDGRKVSSSLPSQEPTTSRDLGRK